MDGASLKETPPPGAEIPEIDARRKLENFYEAFKNTFFFFFYLKGLTVSHIQTQFVQDLPLAVPTAANLDKAANLVSKTARRALVCLLSGLFAKCMQLHNFTVSPY